MATEADTHLPQYDHTKLSNINVCPTWGILRYSMHKRMPGATRSMPLEAGAAAHEAFAAIRWYQYNFFQAKDPIQKIISHKQGVRLFGEARFERMCEILSEEATQRTNCINFTLEALESGEFYDDIGDNRRTLSNISESIIAYIDAYDMERYPIWVRDKTDEDSDIGIEITFDIVVDIEFDLMGEIQELQARFVGILDGLHWNRDNLLPIEEKTGSRLDDAWLSQWILSHQITGYCIAAETFAGVPCNQALVSGTRLPIGKIPSEGIRREHVPRSTVMVEKWANWFVTSILMERQWRENVLDAPMYTHSCNRYFRSCSFLPFCAAESREEKQQIIEEMEEDEWNPLRG